MHDIEVFADVACPFTHAGLRRFTAYRRQLGTRGPTLRVRSWPLELVNGSSHSGAHLGREVEALRVEVAPDLFAGFDADDFPATTLPTLTAAAAAYGGGPERGEIFSLAVRDALWEHGLDVSDPDVLHLAKELDVPVATADDEATVHADLAEGRRRGVTGSPHFFTPRGDFFCPSLDITEQAGTMQVTFDQDGFDRFIAAAFATP
jgi:predicted DsbA family dithiol-disulfide isomerase